MALHKSAWQQHPYGSAELNALLAVDGRKKDLSIRGGECVTSHNYKTTVEWRVDLKNVLSIHHIVMQYAQSKPVWGMYCSSLLSIDICFNIFQCFIRSTVKAANRKLISFMSFENITFIYRAFRV